eukprot:14036659-Alexandrium_andersonii.AAC.1
MSASLVGSEMCIRDSFFAAQHGTEMIARLPVEIAMLPTVAPAWHHYATPVSYTHLTLPTICSV